MPGRNLRSAVLTGRNGDQAALCARVRLAATTTTIFRLKAGGRLDCGRQPGVAPRHLGDFSHERRPNERRDCPGRSEEHTLNSSHSCATTQPSSPRKKKTFI